MIELRHKNRPGGSAVVQRAWRPTARNLLAAARELRDQMDSIRRSYGINPLGPVVSVYVYYQRVNNLDVLELLHDPRDCFSAYDRKFIKVHTRTELAQQFLDAMSEHQAAQQSK